MKAKKRSVGTGLGLVLAIAAYLLLGSPVPLRELLSGVATESAPSASERAPSTRDASAAELIRDAFAKRRSGFMVETNAVVEKTLRDDNDGSRHQRFIIRLQGGHTVLVAHNIDLSKRVPLREGDALRLRGQYEWNERGGVLHWTHHDPEGRHDEGWIEFEGRRYE